MRKVDLVASLPHYFAHLMPIWEALPEETRGDVRWGPTANRTPERERVCMVAGWQDMEPLRGLTSFIYVEHGAGQNYGGDFKSAHWPGYSASRGERHPDMVGYICPSQRVADLFAQRAPAVAVGSPILDARIIDATPPVERTYCFNFHWPCEVAPEAGTAFFHYAPMLPQIVAQLKSRGWAGYSHVHPRWDGRLDDQLKRAGLCPLPDALTTPEIIICDNSSTAFEAAALGRRIIFLNAPQYRRDVHHGLRFWEASRGLTMDEPDELMDLDINWYAINPVARARSLDAANHAYAFIDGRSARRAADAITSWVA